MRGLQFTEQDILNITKKQGYFSLSWHYRVDRTREVCRKMVTRGLLQVKQHSRGVDV